MAVQKLKETPTLTSFKEGKIGHKFIESLRRGRYRLRTVIGEIIDNSDDAGCDHVWIEFGGPSESANLIAIWDNGRGMTKTELKGSYTLGHERSRTSQEIGKFGLGGTLSSLGIAGKKTTVTRDKNGDMYARQYDIAEIKKNDAWGTCEIKITKDLLTMFNSKIPKGTGTMIILQNFDLDVFSTRKDNMKKSIIGYCERTYCEKIAVKSLKLIVDGSTVNSVDPLCWYHPKVIKCADEIIPGTKTRIRVVDLINFNPKCNKADAKVTKSLEKNQGGYFFRCDRLIKSRVTKDEIWDKTWSLSGPYRHCRWAVYFDADEDFMYGTTYDKSDVRPSQSIKDRIHEIVTKHSTPQAARNSVAKKEDTADDLDKARAVLDSISNKGSNNEDSNNEDSNKENSNKENSNKDGVVVPFDKKLPPLNIPKYIIQESNLGELNEAFMWTTNPNEEESEYVLQLNKDHRYVSKFWLQGSQDARDAVTALLVPLAYSVKYSQGAQDEEFTCFDFRAMFNEKLLQSTTKVDKL